MKLSNFFKFETYWKSNSRVSTIITSISFMLLLVLVSCNENSRQVNILPETDQFLQMAQGFAQDAGLPVSIQSIIIIREIQNLSNSAREVVDNEVFIKKDSTGAYMYNKVKDGMELTEAQKNDAAMELIDNNFIEVGDYIVRAEWLKPNGETFYTLGVISANAKPKFEPVLYFNGIFEQHVPNPTQRGWDWNGFTHEVYNGFGMKVVDVEFKVHIATDPQNCMITDPGPHIEITKAAANYPGWTQRTTKGELYWCNPRNNCECRYGSTVPAEECIKFVVVTYAASGFSDVEVEAGANGQVGGVTLDAKIKFKAATFGAEVTHETIRNLCASGSTP